VTVGARDLAGLRSFYLALGWQAVVDLEDFVAFETRGAVFTIYSLERLTADANTKDAGVGEGLRGVTLAINVDSREEVDETIEAARKAGARVTAEPKDMDYGGRTSYFMDPEDNFWEVAWVPADSQVAQAVRLAANLE
jgi:predicted lactoylglutathione lyase